MKSYLILLTLTFVALFMNSCSNTDKRYEIINRVINSSNESINYQLTIRDSLKIEKVSIRKFSNLSSEDAFLSENILSDLNETNEIKFRNFNWQNITIDLNRLSNLKQLEFHYCSFKNVRFKNKKALSKCLFVYCNFDTLDIGEINTTELSYVKSTCEKIEVKSPNRFIESVKFNYSHINDLESSIHNMINLKEIN